MEKQKNMQPLGLIERVQDAKGEHQSQNIVGDMDVDSREIYFLIMHFLSGGPCQRTFTQLGNELMEYQLLPKRYHASYSRKGGDDDNNDGISFPLSYEAAAQRYSHIEKDHLVKLLKQLIVNMAPSRGIYGTTPPTAADVPTLLGMGPFSLLAATTNASTSSSRGDVKGRLAGYLRWPHMQADQVRGIALREIGGGFPKHHRAPSIRFACYAIAKPSTMVQKMQNIKKLRGHRDAVYCAIFDRSGRYVITGSDDRLVKIWSMETAFCLASCRGHEGDITDLAVNSNNAWVASASNDFNIRVWRLPDGMPISVLRGHAGAVTAIAFSPRHSHAYQLLSSSDDGSCRIWDARSSRHCQRIYVPKQTNAGGGTQSNNNKQILCCAYNANGSAFVSGSSDTFARVWSTKLNGDDSEQVTHEMDVLEGHENDVNYVQFSGCAVASRLESSTDEKAPKLKTSGGYSHDNIVTCSRDGSAIIWIPKPSRSHVKTGRWTKAYHLKVPAPPMPAQPRPRQRILPSPRGVNMIVWSLDNRFVLAAIMDCRICVWNASDGRLVHSLTGHTQSTYVLDVHPFNPRIAMSSGYDGKTIIWDIWEGIPIRTYEIGRFKLVDGKFSPDGTSIVLSDDAGQIYLLNTGQGESQKDSKYDQFFLGDYRPLARDSEGNALDQETQLAPYHRNIQDALCDSSMLPYPEPYQSNYQKRRLGALNLEWRPPSFHFAIGTDIGLGGQEYQILPLADLDEPPLPPLPPMLLDAMFWEPENDVIVDSTDSEYNVTADECSSNDEQEPNTSANHNRNDYDTDSSGSREDDIVDRRSKRKRPSNKDLDRRARLKKRNLNDQESRSKQLSKKLKGKSATSSRPQRASARKLSSQGYNDSSSEAEEEEEEDEEEEEEEEEEAEDYLSENEPQEDMLGGSSSTPPPTVEPKMKLLLKFSKKKSLPHEETNSCPPPPREEKRVEESKRKPTVIRIKQKTKIDSDDVNGATSTRSETKPQVDVASSSSQKRTTIKIKFNGDGGEIARETNAVKPEGVKKSESNWLLLEEQEEGGRYIPQVGDEVVYLKQGHAEYIKSLNSSERGPWMLYGEQNTIKDVEICLVVDVKYSVVPGSGASCCKLKLKFKEHGQSQSQTFNLTLPELLNFPDFLVEKKRYDASLERRWSVGDRCCVWWKNEEGDGGTWWLGQVDSIDDTSGSQWEKFVVRYDNDYENPCSHGHWELHDIDKDSQWEQLQLQLQPRLHPKVAHKMRSLFSKLRHSATSNQDKYGIAKLQHDSQKLEFINKFPAPLTLEIIQNRINNLYYRSVQAVKHDISVMLENARIYYATIKDMLDKIRRLSDWFEKKLSKL